MYFVALMQDEMADILAELPFSQATATVPMDPFAAHLDAVNSRWPGAAASETAGTASTAAQTGASNCSRAVQQMPSSAEPVSQAALLSSGASIQAQLAENRSEKSMRDAASPLTAAGGKTSRHRRVMTGTQAGGARAPAQKAVSSNVEAGAKAALQAKCGDSLPAYAPPDNAINRGLTYCCGLAFVRTVQGRPPEAAPILRARSKSTHAAAGTQLQQHYNHEAPTTGQRQLGSAATPPPRHFTQQPEQSGQRQPHQRQHPLFPESAPRGEQRLLRQRFSLAEPPQAQESWPQGSLLATNRIQQHESEKSRTGHHASSRQPGLNSSFEDPQTPTALERAIAAPTGPTACKTGLGERETRQPR